MLGNTVRCIGQSPTAKKNFTPKAYSAEAEIRPDTEQAVQILSAYGNDLPHTDALY